MKINKKLKFLKKLKFYYFIHFILNKKFYISKINFTEIMFHAERLNANFF